MKRLILLPFLALFLYAQSGENEFKKYDENCTKGDEFSCAQIGMTYLKESDLEGAWVYFDRGCKAKFGVSCELKAYMQTQIGEYDEAFKTFSKACDNNSSYSCLNLAVLYDNGNGVKKDIKKATSLFAKACKLGDRSACQMLNVR
ncbi:tetratricopeptide repeat protein [Campylobacter geochelonis]|uniref:beta-lactamase n=1 Tax=Campylobacter geochelonis TaxID=1780362 RepID=A0A128EB26_9BACT|nr:SEL1-like repeat protein [Campylobacter geochelonis]QKF72228.1 Sel1 domain-containing protein [Campylobacter geochelonis]CZE46155.1 putative beta-lactamase HcpC (cysteine-richprotein C) [Campylobacter geochelonis]CZE46472.1 putative beta-lactamase HcpC (cysteine-richprotein C) [Campylobacter geochelonis]